MACRFSFTSKDRTDSLCFADLEIRLRASYEGFPPYRITSDLVPTADGGLVESFSLSPSETYFFKD